MSQYHTLVAKLMLDRLECIISSQIEYDSYINTRLQGYSIEIRILADEGYYDPYYTAAIGNFNFNAVALNGYELKNCAILTE